MHFFADWICIFYETFAIYLKKNKIKIISLRKNLKKILKNRIKK